MSTFWVDMLGGGVEYEEGDMYTSRCLHTGGGDEPPLVLLHGIGGHAETYVKNMQALAEGLPNRSIYALDFVGHGYSSAPTDIGYDISDYGDQIEDFIHSIGHDSAHISGESLGAWVACKMGVNRPEVVESVGLNTIGGLGPSVQDHISDDIREQQQEEMEDLVDRTMDMLEKGFPKDAVRHRLDWLFVEDPEEELVDVRYNIYQRPAVQEAMPLIYDLLVEDATSENYITADELRRLDVPAQVIHTVHNPGAKVEMIEYVDELIPNSEYHLFEHSAHWPQYEEPEQFNEVTIEFIRSQ